jgi:hypothetical protein
MSKSSSDAKAAAPVHTEKLAFIEAAVWENEVGTEGRTRFRVTLSKSYRDGEGAWQRTGNLDPEDIPYAVKVLDRCHTWVAEERYKRASAKTAT